jgi:hypothetical protein
MKIVFIPVRVYEYGDKISTGDGKMVVIHDDLEDIDDDLKKSTPDKIADLCIYRNGITARFLEQTCNHAVGDEVVIDRDYITLIEGGK